MVEDENGILLASHGILVDLGMSESRMKHSRHKILRSVFFGHKDTTLLLMQVSPSLMAPCDIVKR